MVMVWVLQIFGRGYLVVGATRFARNGCDRLDSLGKPVKDWLYATWAALTWRKMLLMQALGQLAILIESTESHLFGTWIGHTSLAYASMVLNVFLTVPVALFADAAIDRGAKASDTYPVAIIMTLPLATIASITMLWVYILIFGLPPT